MTTEQLDFEAAVIIADKKNNGKGPYVATALELHKATGESLADITPLMRKLVLTGQYKGAININKIPMIYKDEGDDIRH